ncbi:MAG: hypothetical protein J0I06_12665 [Planctomycetes bacterium]|nr:hypothetical protein [Planctomycetota bacterium]
MPFASRALVLGLLAFSAGCGASNNKGKIEGHWKFVPGGEPPVEAALRDAVLVFDDEGLVTLTRPGAPKAPVWRYKLLGGDAADFYGLAAERGGLLPNAPDPVRVTIRIEVTPAGRFEHREMTLTDAQGRSVRLVRVRE